MNGSSVPYGAEFVSGWRPLHSPLLVLTSPLAQGKLVASPFHLFFLPHTPLATAPILPLATATRRAAKTPWATATQSTAAVLRAPAAA